MKELRTEIEIGAPIEKVWSVLMDFENWKEWNPIVNSVRGNSVKGSKLNIIMKGKDGSDSMKYDAVITDSEEPKTFRWRATMMAGFLFTNDKIFDLEATATGTKLIHREEFTGMLLPLFWSKLEKGALPMLKTMNEALKSKVN